MRTVMIDLSSEILEGFEQFETGNTLSNTRSRPLDTMHLIHMMQDTPLLEHALDFHLNMQS